MVTGTPLLRTRPPHRRDARDNFCCDLATVVDEVARSLRRYLEQPKLTPAWP